VEPSIHLPKQRGRTTRNPEFSDKEKLGSKNHKIRNTKETRNLKSTKLSNIGPQLRLKTNKLENGGRYLLLMVHQC